MERVKEKICVVGGGNVGTVLAGFMAARGYRVSVLTGRPAEWSDVIEVADPAGRKFAGKPECVSADPAEALAGASVALLCLPGNAIMRRLDDIKPWLGPGTLTGSVFSCTGFFIMAVRALGPAAPLFGLQRVPFISRLDRYGKSARLLGYRDSIKVAFRNVADTDGGVRLLADMFATPVSCLSHPMEATLTNSNPILHPSRLYAMFRDCTSPVERVPYFYADWDDESSRLLMACDEEFQAAVARLGIAPGRIPRLLDYYESHDAESLTRKIRSIAAFREIKAPVKAVDGGYLPDFDNRYFTEDFPYGMLLVKTVCRRMGVATPTMDTILAWFQERVGRHYVDGDEVADSPDCREVACLDAEALDIIINNR